MADTRGLPERLDAGALKTALQDADYRVLLMVVFHLSGDHKWLRAPYLPRRDVKLIADEDSGLAEEVRADIRNAAMQLLAGTRPESVICDPGNDLMRKMMSVCIAENVPPEYAPMMREELGFVDRRPAWSTSRPVQADDFPVLIAGAGESGIVMAANLQKLGIPFLIVEKNDNFGGTWLENTYPGCGVDTPNFAYSFSFGERYPWSRCFANQPEILDYFFRSARSLDLEKNTWFGSTVRACSWDAAGATWRVQIDRRGGAETVTARALVSAVGQLNEPSVPPIPGIDRFDGPIFHSSSWPAGLDLKGKRVAVVGTGASAMQIVPAIVDEVSELTVFQRSPQWVRPIPRYKDPIKPGARWLLDHVPYYAEWVRFSMFWRYGDGLLPTLRRDPAWPHPERAMNSQNDRHRQQMTDHLLAELADRPDLIAACLPTYPAYGKRILLDNGWFRAIRKDHVKVVAGGVSEITEAGLADENGVRYGADIIVLATGFKVGRLAARLNMTGLAGRKLEEAWAADDPRAYLGISVAGFPNLFVMQGPNTGLGHGGSAIFQSECQARYIAKCIMRLIGTGSDYLDVKSQAEAASTARVDAEHAGLIWSHPGMSTYYRNSLGRVVSVMPWRLVDYWRMTEEPDTDDYEFGSARPGGSIASPPQGAASGLPSLKNQPRQ
jgi:4-hydroxyacetophenone monooxygenase